LKPTAQLVLLVIGSASGILLAYIDSLPKWDDAGIIAGGLLLTSGLLTLFGFRRPWLLGLCVGLWVPLRGILTALDFSLLLLLIFPLLGAYAGFFLRSGLKMGQPSA
jgi:hypothetical protein